MTPLRPEASSAEDLRGKAENEDIKSGCDAKKEEVRGKTNKN